MGRAKVFLGALGGGVALLGLVAGGSWIWASRTSDARLARIHESHRVDLPVPFPLTDDEVAALRDEMAGDDGTADAANGARAEERPDPLAGMDLAAIALDRARTRGKHLVEARYVCIECHGEDFGGGVMIDGMPLAVLHGPNLTTGKGSRVLDYTMADWDRAVRHGILPDGRASVMPAVDFVDMSDRELSDIIAYIRSMPPVDREMPPRRFGPLGTVLMATGKLEVSAEHQDHQRVHLVEPPPEGESVEFGAHLVKICTGCHRAGLEGGPNANGDPSWPPAANLTPHAEGLAGWTFDDFQRLMLTGKRPNGTDVAMPMSLMPKYAANMTATEMKALWLYLEQLPPTPTGK